MNSLEYSLRAAANDFVASVMEAVRDATARAPVAREGGDSERVDRLEEELRELTARLAVLEKSAQEALGAPKRELGKIKKTRLRRQPDLVDRVTKILSDFRGPMAIGDIVGMVGLPVGHVRTALHEAMDRGWVQMSGTKRLARYSFVTHPEAKTFDSFDSEPPHSAGVLSGRNDEEE
jgi:hypothetical protein